MSRKLIFKTPTFLTSNIFKKQKVRLLPVLGAFICYVAVIFFNITRSSVWFDESYTLFLMRFNVDKIIYFASVDIHPPLYYLFLKLWVSVFGLNIFTTRLFSGFIGLICVFLMGKLILSFNKYVCKISFISGICVLYIFSLNPLFIRYCIESRMYMLDLSLAILLTIILIKILYQKDKTPKHELRLYFYYAIVCAFGIWTHYYFLLYITANLVWYFLVKKKRGLNKHFFMTLLTLFILYIPWIATAYRQITTSVYHSWTPPFQLKFIIDFFSEVLLFIPFNFMNLPISILTLFIIILIVILFICSWKKVQYTDLIIWCLVTVFGSVFLIDYLDSYVSRYVIWALIPFSMMFLRPRTCETENKFKRMLFNKVMPVFTIFIIIIECSVGLSNLAKFGNYTPYEKLKPNTLNYVNIVKNLDNNQIKYILVEDYSAYINWASYQDQTFMPCVLKRAYKETKLWNSHIPIEEGHFGKGVCMYYDEEGFLEQNPNSWIAKVDAMYSENITLKKYSNGKLEKEI